LEAGIGAKARIGNRTWSRKEDQPVTLYATIGVCRKSPLGANSDAYESGTTERENPRGHLCCGQRAVSRAERRTSWLPVR